MVHNAYLLSFLTFYSSACKNQLFRQGNSNSSCQSLCSSSSRNQTPVGLRKTHFGVFRGDSDICIKSKFKTSTKSRTINETENRTVNVPQIVKNSSEVIDDIFDFIFSFVESLFEVGSCTEMSFNTASENNCSESTLLVYLFDSAIKLN